MLGEVAELTKGYLSWVEYGQDDSFIRIKENYMNTGNGKCLMIWVDVNAEYSMLLYTLRREVLHGISKGWYKSGQIAMLRHYKCGQLLGTYTDWYKNGQMANKRVYINGQRHGKQTFWYPDGRINCEEYWDNGKQVN